MTKIFGMLWENVDEFGDEQKILEMFIVCVAEEYEKKGLATKLEKVGVFNLKNSREKNQIFLKPHFGHCERFLLERASSISRIACLRYL